MKSPKRHYSLHAGNQYFGTLRVLRGEKFLKIAHLLKKAANGDLLKSI
jgi:hypothetical protein